MLELIFSAIGLGFMLSLVLIGPVFFLLIETSLTKGHRSALALNFGVIAGDILCILVAYYSSQDLLDIIEKHPGFYKITAFILFIYGLYMYLSKTKMHLSGDQKLVTKNYVKTFVNGFLLNVVNIGVVVFWIITVISIRSRYSEFNDFVLYMAVVLATFFGIDLMKIYLARSFHNKITPKAINMVRKVVGIILIGFSIFVYMKSLGYFRQIDQKIDEQTRKKEVVK
jgi:threonine/homoserine/homoserine lactone efflux protein